MDVDSFILIALGIITLDNAFNLSVENGEMGEIKTKNRSRTRTKYWSLGHYLQRFKLNLTRKNHKVVFLPPLFMKFRYQLAILSIFHADQNELKTKTPPQN